MDEASEVALEDYARVLDPRAGGGSRPAEGTPGMVEGVHLCGAALPVAPATLADIEGFAESLLALRAGGLGWS